MEKGLEKNSLHTHVCDLIPTQVDVSERPVGLSPSPLRRSGGLAEPMVHATVAEVELGQRGEGGDVELLQRLEPLRSGRRSGGPPRSPSETAAFTMACPAASACTADDMHSFCSGIEPSASDTGPISWAQKNWEKQSGSRT